MQSLLQHCQLGALQPQCAASTSTEGGAFLNALQSTKAQLDDQKVGELPQPEKPAKRQKGKQAA